MLSQASLSMSQHRHPEPITGTSMQAARLTRAIQLSLLPPFVKGGGGHATENCMTLGTLQSLLNGGDESFQLLFEALHSLRQRERFLHIELECFQIVVPPPHCVLDEVPIPPA